MASRVPHELGVRMTTLHQIPMRLCMRRRGRSVGQHGGRRGPSSRARDLAGPTAGAIGRAPCHHRGPGPLAAYHALTNTATRPC
jgi:hypothetical protein